LRERKSALLIRANSRNSRKSAFCFLLSAFLIWFWPSLLMGAAFFTLTTTNRIEIPDFYTAQISVVARVYTICGNSNVNNTIIGQDASGNRSWSVIVYWATNQGVAQFQISDNAANYVRCGSTLGAVKSNQWVHLVFTYDTAAIVRVYVNGVLSGTNVNTVYTNLINATGIVTIGGRDYVANEGMFWGHIEDLAVFNRSISASEVDWLFRNSVVGAAQFLPGLLSYWDLTGFKDNEDLTGQRIMDSYGTNHGVAKNLVRASSNTQLTH
jgi:hypothetical protein